MITTLEVGAVFRIINEASPALAEILKQVRALNRAMTTARKGMASLGTSISSIRLGAAVGETDALAASWELVAKNASAARLAMGQAARMPSVAGAAGGGGSRHRPGWLGGGGAHISGPSAPLPGGSHIRLGGGTAMAAAGVLGWGIDQAVKTDDYSWKLEDIAGLAHNEANHSKFRKMLQDFQISSGFGIDEAGKAALADIRLLQGTIGGGVDTLPEMLSAAATEARRKNTGLEESMTSNVELAHQFRAYKTDDIKKLFATFAALSTADPRSLSSMSRAAGYAVPGLSEIGVDPSSVLLAGTALARAGISSTKSGTWISEAATRAMPGVVLGHKALNTKHEEALKLLRLIGPDGKPTWFGDDGKPDLMKMFGIAGDAMQGMSPQDRAAYGRAAFGAQGSRAVAILGDPAVREQVRALNEITKSSGYAARYKSFSADYQAGSTMQAARAAMQEFNVVTGEIGRQTIPSLNIVLGEFRSILEGIRRVLPGGDGKGAATVGARAIVGAGIGAGWGVFGGPLGIAGGAVVGGIAGGVEGVAEQYMKNLSEPHDRFGRETVITGNSAAQAAEGMKALGDAIKGLPAGRGSVFPGGSSPTPLSVTMAIDGTVLGRVLMNIGAGSFDGQAPAFDGLSEHQGGAAQHSDK